jgi:hypothetical protein
MKCNLEETQDTKIKQREFSKNLSSKSAIIFVWFSQKEY